MPIMPIYIYVRTRLVKPWVGGYEPNIMDHHRSKNFFILAH
jgi:oligopeptide transport system substrate-binding protein